MKVSNLNTPNLIVLKQNNFVIKHKLKGLITVCKFPRQITSQSLQHNPPLFLSNKKKPIWIQQQASADCWSSSAWQNHQKRKTMHQRGCCVCCSTTSSPKKAAQNLDLAAGRPVVDRPQASLTSPRNGRSRSLAYVKEKSTHTHTLYGAGQTTACADNAPVPLFLPTFCCCVLSYALFSASQLLANLLSGYAQRGLATSAAAAVELVFFRCV